MKTIAALAAFVVSIGLAGPILGQEADSGVGKTLSINGMTMYFETHGEGEPLLLLHGFSSSGRESWQPFVKELSAEFKLIIPDLRGHGRSTNPLETFTHRQCALDMYALLDQLRIGKIKAMGMSTGGMTLLHMATQQPERVTRMVLIGAAQYFPEEARTIMRRTTEDVLTENGAWWGYKRMRKVHAHGDEQIRKLRRQYHGFKDSYDDVNFTPPLLSTIKAKTLIIHGDRDEFFPVEMAVEMYRSIPNASLWIIPNGGHLLFLDGSMPFVARTLAFLGEPGTKE